MADQVFIAGQILTAAQMQALQINSALVPIKYQTIGSAQTSIAVASAFSTTFDNYLIQISGGVASTAVELRLQMTGTTSGYYYQLLYGGWAGLALAEGSTTAASFVYTGTGTTSGLMMNCNVMNPFNATATMVQAPFMTASLGAGVNSGLLPNTTSYTGFTIVVAGGNVTGGTIAVYGYRKA